MGSHKHQVFSSAWQLCRGLYSWRCCQGKVCPRAQLAVCQDPQVSRAELLPSQAAPACITAPGSSFLAARCHSFSSPACPYAPHWKPVEPPLLVACTRGLTEMQRTGSAGLTEMQRTGCPCGVLVIGLQAEHIPLKPSERAHPVSPHPLCHGLTHTEQYWEILGEAVGSLATAFRKESI